MLTNSCVKLQTVHHIPLTINKEGRAGLLGIGLGSWVSGRAPGCWADSFGSVSLLEAIPGQSK